MLRIIQIVITLGFLSEVLAEATHIPTTPGDLQISGGGNSGQLQFDIGYGNWGGVCKDGFDDNAGDVACRQLGYVQSSDVYVYSYYYNSYDINVCYTYCGGSEDRLKDCDLVYCSICDDGVVGITCTNGLTAGQIAAIVISVVVFIALIATFVTLCICCLSPTCPCYYHRYRSTQTVVVAAQQTPQVVTATTTNTNTINYQPSPPAPPAYNPATGYQPYPAAPPPATTVNY